VRQGNDQQLYQKAHDILQVTVSKQLDSKGIAYSDGALNLNEVNVIDVVMTMEVHTNVRRTFIALS
jgi:hypothetical protein